MAKQLAEAHVVVVPGYSVVPEVPGYWVSFAGRACAANEILAGYRQLQLDARLQDKMLVLLDKGTSRISQDTGFSWLLLGARRDAFQYGVDISMPAEPSPRCSGISASSSFQQPLGQKRYLLSFKGSFRDYPLAGELAVLHRDNWNVLVVDAAHTGYDTEYLLWNSVFNLVFASAADRDSRFNEVVCSGGIPVAVADSSWVSPFDGFIRFRSYGILVDDTDLSTLLPRLGDVLLNSAEARLLREPLGWHEHAR